MSDGLGGFASASRSERGIRDTNEDAVLSTPLPGDRWLAAVADGMGGLEGGETASRTALGALAHALEGGRSLLEAMEEANRLVFRRREGRPAGTTLVAALFQGDRVRIANVGDSRAYLLGPVGLVQVTKDHTFGAEASERGDAVAREVAASRWGGTLTRSMGAAETVEVDEFGPLALESDVRVLLCSDGVHGVLPDEEIERCLEDGRSLEECLDRLLALALERGGEDNLSAVLLRRASERPPRREPGIDPRTGGVPEADEGFVLSDVERTARTGAREPWDPARLARRAPGARRRKPGTLRAALLILALGGLVLLMLALLP